MTIEQIRKAARAVPFVPFTISLADGRQYPIRHPELILVPAEATRIVVAESPDEYSIVDLLLVVSLDFKKRAGRNRGNGRGNGKPRAT